MEHPSVLILDEPFNGLDSIAIKQIREYLLEQKKSGVTVLIASHMAEDIEILCDKVYQMENGKIVGEE